MPFQKRAKKETIAGNQEPLTLEGAPVTELEVQGPKGVVVVSVPKNLQQWMRNHFAKVSVMLADWHEKMGPGADPAEFRKYVDSLFTKLYGQTVHLDVAPSGLDLENMNPEQLAALYALLQKASGQELKSLPANIEVGEFHKVEGEYDSAIDGSKGVSGEASGSSGPRNQGLGLGGIAIGGRDSVEQPEGLSGYGKQDILPSREEGSGGKSPRLDRQAVRARARRIIEDLQKRKLGGK